LDLAEEFRDRAQRCLTLAQGAPTLEAQTHWLAMAQLWLGLAEHAEGQEARFFGDSTLHLDIDGRSGGDSCPAGGGEGEDKA
jgi:hypothetical protein